ncbi:MAG: hypothetical protein CSB23_03785 [Deltaproteobacteria bacterium]|nr:MAG: hypothetical protein CSB23_03785 [Deltaproteobacteria bacterium]
MNMNRFVFYGFLVLLVIYLLVFRFDGEAEKDLVRFVADDAVFYVEQNDCLAASDAFKRSLLGQQLAAIDLQRVGPSLGLTENAGKLVEALGEELKTVVAEPLLGQLLRGRLGIALFRLPSDVDRRSLVTWLKRDVLFIVKPRENIDWNDVLVERFAKKRQGRRTTCQYGNYRIARLPTRYGVITLASIDGLVVASYDERQLKKAIDTYDGEIAGLPDRADFGKAFALYDTKREHLCYLSLSSLQKMVHLFSSSGIPYLEKMIEKLPAVYSAFTYGHWSTKKTMQSRLVLSGRPQVFDKKEGLQSLSPIQSRVLDFSLYDPLLLYWTTGSELQTILSRLLLVEEFQTLLYAYQDRLQKIAGVAPSDLPLLFGDQVGIFIEPSGSSNFFHIPRCLAVIPLASSEQAETLAKDLVEAFAAPVFEEIYEAVIYSYWLESPQDGIQPLCGFWQNYLFIGNSVSLLREIVDDYNARNSLVKNPQIRKIDPGIKEKNNRLLYLNVERTSELLVRLFYFIDTLLKLERPEKAEKSHLIIREVLLPLTAGIQDYERLCLRSYRQSELVIIDARFALRQIKKKRTNAKNH